MSYSDSMKKFVSETTGDEFSPMSKAEEQALFKSRKSKKKIADVLVKRNMRLINMVAKRYSAYLDYDDMVMEGILGLYKASETFDPSKNIKFCTYAYWYVFKAIQEYMRKENNSMDLTRNRACVSFNDNDMNRQDGDKGESNPWLENACNNSPYAPHISTPINTMATRDYNTFMESVRSILFDSTLLDKREKMVIKERYLSDKKKTLKQLGDKLKLSHSMVKLIEDKAMAKIKVHLQKSGFQSINEITMENVYA